MNFLSELFKIVPPPAQPVWAGSHEIWKQVTERIHLPDELFEFYHRYGSGEFQIFDSQDVSDVLRLFSVFEKPLLRRHEEYGKSHIWENEQIRLPVEFFPESKDGLFTIASNDQRMHVMFDPKEPKRTHLMIVSLAYFKVFDVSILEYLYLSFSGKEDLDLFKLSEGEQLDGVELVPYGHRRYDPID